MITLLKIPLDTLVLRLTAIVILVRGFLPYTGEVSLLNVALAILAATLLLSRELLYQKWIWLALAVLMTGHVLTHWLATPNHRFVFVYWTLACFLAVRAKDRPFVLRQNGLRLIGLIFIFATLWKFQSGEYLDGSFLHTIFLTYTNLDSIPFYFGGLDLNQVIANKGLWATFQIDPVRTAEITLHTNSLLKTISLALSYAGLMIEAALGIAFLFDKPVQLIKHRHLLLLVFLATAFWIAPIDRFALLLCIMGLATLPPHVDAPRRPSQRSVRASRVPLRLIFLAAYALFFLLPFVPLLNRILTASAIT